MERVRSPGLPPIEPSADLCATVQAFDAQGNEIEINDNDSEDDDDIVKRSKFKVLIRLAKVIKKYGKRALSFFKCISWNTTLHCASQVILFGDSWDWSMQPLTIWHRSNTVPSPLARRPGSALRR